MLNPECVKKRIYSISQLQSVMRLSYLYHVSYLELLRCAAQVHSIASLATKCMYTSPVPKQYHKIQLIHHNTKYARTRSPSVFVFGSMLPKSGIEGTAVTLVVGFDPPKLWPLPVKTGIAVADEDDEAYFATMLCNPLGIDLSVSLSKTKLMDSRLVCTFYLIDFGAIPKKYKCWPAYCQNHKSSERVIYETADAHGRNRISRGHVSGGIHITLQEVYVGILFGQCFEHRRYLVARAAPRSVEVDDLVTKTPKYQWSEQGIAIDPRTETFPLTAVRILSS